MGDAGEGLIDAEARIQERMEEVARLRAEKKIMDARDPKAQQALEAIRLGRAEMQRQYDATSHEQRRKVLKQAIDELDQKAAALIKSSSPLSTVA